MNKKLKILIIGPLPPPYGGARVLFKNIIQDFKKRKEIKVSVMETWKRNDNNFQKIINIFKISWSLFFKIKKNDLIIFFASNKGGLFLSPYINLISKLFGKPWIFRKFGGNLEFRKNLSIFKADLCLLETKKLVKSFSKKENNIKWHANCRKLREGSNKIKEKAQKFIFLGHVRPEKGIKEILSLNNKLKKDITIDIYGKCQKGITQKSFKNLKNINYRGLLKTKEVLKTLLRYDALLLPTYYQNEGYPGVILEAYNFGLPVISTNWGGIPEIVDKNSGILIKPKDSRGLLKAILKINKDKKLFQKLQKGAKDKSKEFSLKKWNNILIKYCKEVLKNE